MPPTRTVDDYDGYAWDMRRLPKWVRQVRLGGAVLGILFVVWLVRPVLALRVVGFSGPGSVLLSYGRECGRAGSHIVCSNSPVSKPFPPVQDAIWLSAFTRTVEAAQRTWQIGDSAAWTTAIDSVRRAFEARGAQQYVCERDSEGSEPETNAPVKEEWRLPARTMILLGYHRTRFTPLPGWQVCVRYQPRGQPLCAPDTVRHYPTPEQLGRAMRDWWTDRLGW